MTLDEVKNVYSKEQLGYNDWKNFYIRNYEYVTGIKKIEYAMEQIAIIYACEKCREQREICAERHATIFHSSEIILNSPEPKFD